MKRLGTGLYEQIISKDNLYLAHINASKGKSHYNEVKEVNSSLDIKVEELHTLLKNRMFRTSPYRIAHRVEGGKLRDIYILPYYPDRIVQHALLQQIGDRFYTSFIRDTFQSIKGRGTSDARKRVSRFIRNHNPSHYLQMDISKFYPSVPNKILKAKVRKLIKCTDSLCLLDNIIDSCKGLPIGNYTSQVLGNYYLTDLDWFIKQNLGVKGYFRYCDDLVLFGNSPKELHSIQHLICEFVSSEGLHIKPDWKVAKLNTGCDFVGYQFFDSGIKLRDSIYKSAKEALEISPEAVPAYFGWVKVLKDSKIKSRYYNAINKTGK